jgi:hypothetical protein
MELKKFNPNGERVVASKLINFYFLLFGNCKKLNSKMTSYVIFSIRCHDCPKNKIPHIVYLTNQH